MNVPKSGKLLSKVDIQLFSRNNHHNKSRETVVSLRAAQIRTVYWSLLAVSHHITTHQELISFITLKSRLEECEADSPAVAYHSINSTQLFQGGRKTRGKRLALTTLSELQCLHNPTAITLEEDGTLHSLLLILSDTHS